MFLGLETGRNFESFRLFCHRLSMINIYLVSARLELDFHEFSFV